MKVMRPEHGFTLVEMVVALAIFAILASAGVSLLRASVGTQEVVVDSLADLAASARLRALLQADLGQAVVRPVAAAPSGFAGNANSLVLVRSYDTLSRAPGSTGLQAVRWTMEKGNLTREVIGADGSTLGNTTILAREVQSLTMRYRAADGRWIPGWSNPPVLPAAVEVNLQRRGEATVTMVIALPQGPAQIPDVVAQVPAA